MTALRWGRILRGLGHRTLVREEYRKQGCDVLVALHARHSFSSVERFRRDYPDRPIVLALTGTDLYCDIHVDRSAQQSMERASRLIVLQPMGVSELPGHLRDKARVIYQSVELGRLTVARREVSQIEPVGGRRVYSMAEGPPGSFQQSATRTVTGLSPPATDHSPLITQHSLRFRVCVLGHLRPVKDPFRTAKAARLLPESSRVEVKHVGAALSERMARMAQAEMSSNQRYQWLGELPRWKALRVLARSKLLVLSSEIEGGANAVCEAIALGVAVLSSRISGSIGILGRDYPGYFPVGDTRALASLLERAESDAQFYNTLQLWCERLRPLVDPARERHSWQDLLDELKA